MSNQDRKSKKHRTVDLVKETILPKYDYQKAEYGFGSAGGKQNNASGKSSKKSGSSKV